MSVCLGAQRVLPPKVLRVVVLHEVAGCLACKVCLGSQSYCVAKQWEVQISAEVQVHHSWVSTSHPNLSSYIEVEGMPLRLRQ